MDKNRIFTHLSHLKGQFGNMLTLSEKLREQFTGISEVFFSSIIQFQPLCEFEMFDEDGRRILPKLIRETSSPTELTRVYEGEHFLLEQNIVAYGDSLASRHTFRRTQHHKAIYTLRMSGACLFSPQGVPYYWDQEKRMEAQLVDCREVRFTWRNTLELSLQCSIPFNRWNIRGIGEDEVEKQQYWSSFNLKKRYTYWTTSLTRTAGFEAQAENAFARDVVYAGECDIDLKNQESAELRFDVHTSMTSSSEKTECLLAGYEEFAEQKKQAWNTFLEEIPWFECADTELERVYYMSWYVLHSGKVQVDEARFAYPFTSVNKFHYYNQFFWDSAFHALAWQWYNRKDPAENELKNFVLNQFRNGMIPYELFLFPTNGREWMESDAKTTNATQPPVLAISILEIYKKFGDKSFLEFFYEPLLRYERWLWQYRDLGKRGLSCVTNIWETGCDNSPRFDNVARNRVLDPYVEEVDFNVFLYILRKNLIEIADILGKEMPAEVVERAEMTKTAMNTLMYHKDDGFYYDLLAGESESIRLKTNSGLMPLMTDIPDAAMRQQLIDRYLLSEDEFLTGCPVPTVSKSEASFSSYDFWRGAAWPQITWSVIYGVKPYDATAASIVLDRFLSSTSSCLNCYEYYDSESGEGIGLAFQGWGTLYIDMILRHLVGIEPLPDGVAFRPLDTRYADFKVENLKLMKTVVCSVKRMGDLWEFDVNGEAKIRMQQPIPFVLFKTEKGFSIHFEDEPDWDKTTVEGCSVV